MDDQQRTNKRYHNWLKAALGLKYLKQGVGGLVEDEVKDQQTDFLTDISNFLGSNVVCNQCSTENVVPCKTRGLCYIKNGNCSFHNDVSKMPRLCPNQVCNTLYNKITDQHRYKSPSWKNTDARLWCSTPWEVAKCYMAESGYRDKPTVAETDCPGVLSVIINALFLQNALTTIINPKVDIVCKNRKARNDIMHAATLELSDGQLDEYIDDMLLLLSDDKKILNHPDAITAKQKVIELKDESFCIVPKDEMELRKEAVNALEDKKVTALNEIKEELNHAIKSISEKHQAGHDNLSEKEKEISSSLVKACTDQCQSINEVVIKACTTAEESLDTKLKQALEVIQNSIDQGKATIQNQQLDVQTNFNQSVQQIQQAVEKCKQDIGLLTNDVKTRQNKHQETIDFLTKKQDLQTYLRRMYKRHKSTISISPLLSSVTADISDVYTELIVRDDLANDPDKFKAKEQEHQDTGFGKKGKLLHEIMGNSKKIFVLGDAGMGKTTWCLNLIKTWLSALDKLETNSDLDDDEKALSKFEFLFYAELRHALKDKEISQMISKQLFESSPNINEFAHDIMNKESEKCLVVLDGLDEWSRPTPDSIDTTGLPLRDETLLWTVITTSRLWRMSQLDLKRNEIDKVVEIKGLDESDITELSNKLVNKLNDNTGLQKDASQFTEDVGHNLSRFMTVPLMLTALVCLWYNGGKIDGTLTQVYAGLLAIMIQAFEKRIHDKPDIKSLSLTKEKWSQYVCQLPDILKKQSKLNEYRILLLKLGNLAFTGLFSPDKESCLVFTNDTIQKHLKDEELQIGLKIGILTQTKVVGNVLEREFKVSFLHKTIQEFLAAIYMTNDFINESLVSIDTFKKYCVSDSTVHEMENVLLFLSGLCPQLAGQLSEYISGEVQMLSDIYKYNSLYQLLIRCLRQTLLVSQAGKSQIYIKYHTLDPLFFKYEMAESIQYIEHNVIRNMSLRIVIEENDSFAKLTNMLIHCCFIEELNIRTRYGQQLDNLNKIQDILLNNINLTSLELSSLRFLSKKDKLIKQTLNLEKNTALVNLSLYNCSTLTIILPSCTYLRHINLTKLSEETTQYVLDHLHNATLLESLQIGELSHEDEKMYGHDFLDNLIALKMDCRRLLNLISIRLNHIKITQWFLPKHSEKLNEVKLCNIQFTQEDCVSELTEFIEMVQPRLDKTHLHNIRQETTCIEPLKQISFVGCTTLTSLKIMNVWHPDPILSFGYIELTQSRHLSVLDVHRVPIQSLQLPKHGCLREINLCNIECHITIFGIQNQHQLEKLNIDNLEGRLGHVDLSSCRSLHDLNLSGLTVERLTMPSSPHSSLRDVTLTNITAIQGFYGFDDQQQQLRKLSVDDCTGSFETIDLNKITNLKTVTIKKITVGRCRFLDLCCIQEIILNDIEDEIELISLTNSKKLYRLSLRNVHVGRIELPKEGCLFAIEIRDVNMSDGLFGISDQNRLTRFELENITGQLGTIDLTNCKLLKGDDITLKNLSKEKKIVLK